MPTGNFIDPSDYNSSIHREILDSLVRRERSAGVPNPDYDPETHLGGVEYLYLRGIDPAHPANGKYGWNYPPEFVAGLDRILGHEAA